MSKIIEKLVEDFFVEDRYGEGVRDIAHRNKNEVRIVLEFGATSIVMFFVSIAISTCIDVFSLSAVMVTLVTAVPVFTLKFFLSKWVFRKRCVHE